MQAELHLTPDPIRTVGAVRSGALCPEAESCSQGYSSISGGFWATAAIGAARRVIPSVGITLLIIQTEEMPEMASYVEKSEIMAWTADNINYRTPDKPG